MTLAYDIAYSNLVHTVVQGVPGFLQRMYSLFEVPDAAQKGAVTVTLLDAITSSTIVDGTMQTNDHGQTAVTMTLADKAVTLSLRPTAAKSSLTKPENMAIIAYGAANAIVKVAQEAVIAAMVAATPAITDTLTIGQIDFGHDGSDGEQADNLKTLLGVLVLCGAKHADLPYSDFTIVMPPAGLGNFTSIRANLPNNPVLGPDGMWSFMGAKVFTLDYSTNFGAATKAAAFIFNTRNYGMKFTEIGLFGGGPMYASDAHVKWIHTAAYCHGIIFDDHIGEIVNPAS